MAYEILQVDDDRSALAGDGQGPDAERMHGHAEIETWGFGITLAQRFDRSGGHWLGSSSRREPRRRGERV